MESTRVNKISRLIQRELSDFFQKQGKSMFGGQMISVTVVRVTKDLGLAKVYLSVFPKPKSEDPLKSVNDNFPKIKHDLGNRLKNQMKKIPELVFYYDDSLDYIDNINNLLKKS